MLNLKTASRRIFHGMLLASGMVLSGAFLFPASFSGSAKADGVSSRIKLSITPVIDISVSDTELAANNGEIIYPTSTGDFYTVSTNVTVATNVSTGYSLSMSGLDGQVDLLPSDSSVTSKIISTPTDATESTFKSNTWGYSLDGTNFHGIPADLSVILSSPVYGNGEVTSVTFGMKVDDKLLPDTYSDTIVFTASAVDPTPVSTNAFSNITTM